MKILILLCFLTLGVAHAQDVVSPQEWKRENDLSLTLAAKLFPDLTREGTRLLQVYGSISDGMSVSNPRITHESYKPLYMATLAGQATGVAPKWSALTDNEKLEAFQQVSYVSNLVALIAGQQQRYIAQLTNGGGGDTSFNPGALEGPAARQVYAPQPQQPQDRQHTVMVTSPDGTVSQVIVTPQN